MTKRHWLVALMLALSVHAAPLMLTAVDESAPAGAYAVGAEGLEAGYGLAGSYADMLRASQPSPEPKPAEASTRQESVAVAETKPAPIIDVAPTVNTATDSVALAARYEADPTPAPSLEPLSDDLPAAEPPSQTIAGTKAAAESTSERSDSQATSAAVRATGSADRETAGAKTVGDARSYFARLMAWLNQYKTYPAEAKKFKHQGVVSVQFSINAGGDVVSREVKHSSGHPQLDAAALAMFDAASPLPAIPPFMQRQHLTLVLPVEFSLITNNSFKE